MMNKTKCTVKNPFSLWNPIPKHGNWALIMELDAIMRFVAVNYVLKLRG